MAHERERGRDGTGEGQSISNDNNLEFNSENSSYSQYDINAK